MKYLIISFLVFTSACATTPPPQEKLVASPALLTLIAKSHLEGPENRIDPAIGLPDQVLRRPMTCTQKPVWDVYGYYVRTDVECTSY